MTSPRTNARDGLLPAGLAVVLVLVAVGLGLLAADALFVGSGKSLIVWAIAAAAIGWVAPTPRAAAARGAVFGFAVSLSFLLFSYDGHAAVLAVAALDLALGLFGAACGAVIAAVAAVVRARTR